MLRAPGHAASARPNAPLADSNAVTVVTCAPQRAQAQPTHPDAPVRERPQMPLFLSSKLQSKLALGFRSVAPNLINVCSHTQLTAFTFTSPTSLPETFVELAEHT
jgi:hypothetical protein